MTKKAKALLSVGCVFMALLICACVVLGAITVHNLRTNADAIAQNTELVKRYVGETEDVDAEDDVLIANQYMIKSTTQISDAYKSKDASALDDRDKETLDLASKIIDEIIKPDMSDYEKEEAVYLYLTTKLKSTNGILTVISSSTDNYEPHDVLKNKSAVCVGYATTFRMFMQMLGIECKVVHSSDLSHSWDLVKLDDGWYHVDCYSDNDSTTYANFNMDDQYCSMNHNWSREYFPAANGTKYNYVLMNKKELKDIYALPEYAAKAISKKKGVIACTFKSFGEKDQHAANYMADSIQNNFSTESQSVSCQWVLDADNNYVLVMTVMYSNSSSLEIDGKTSEKIDNAIFEAIDKYELNNQSY